jgi:hypothetical protein
MLTLEELIQRFRVLADDLTIPHRADGEDVMGWFNDAQAQAAIRGRLLVAEGDANLCRVALQPGQSMYPLHRSIYEIIHLRLIPALGRSRPVSLKSREWLDAEMPDWRDCPRPASIAIQTDTGLRVVGMVEPGDVLELEAYRLPLKKLENDSDKPEIHGAHHEHLVQWALHKAFSVPDSELFDPNRATLAERAFTKYFGPLPDSGMRRETRHDVPHVNKAWFP